MDNKGHERNDNVVQALMDIWGTHCEKGDYVFISAKDPESGSWKDLPLKYDNGFMDNAKEVLEKYPSNKYNLYFCPLPFSQPKRRKKNFKGSKWLWSDMDEVNPEETVPKPTIYWESSPKRYQGLWKLDQFLDPQRAEEMNKGLTYEIGSDKGGWDVTQVLRIPNTINHKYKNKPKVGSFKRTNKKYSVKNLATKILKNDNKNDTSNNSVSETNSDLNVNKILAKYKKKIPRDVKNLLFAKKAEVGKRSDIIWYLENKLSEAGLSPEEIIVLIRNSVWNKYRGRSDEEERFRSELSKIIEQKIQEPEVPEVEPGETGLTVESYKDVMSNMGTFPGWLIDGFWMRRSHGIVAGEPKSFKSVLSLDLAVSVASGQPFLNMFPVKERGPVLIIQNENSDWIMKDRLEKIITHKRLTGNMKIKNRKLKGEFPPELPIYFINQQAFMLNDAVHQKIVEKTIERIEPVLIIFDPLYLMFDGDVNSAKDLNPVLNWLLNIKNDFRTGIMVIHHWNKSKTAPRGGQKMLGSTTLHGWVESAWYIGIKGEESEQDEEQGAPSDENILTGSSGKPVSLVMEREFRAGGIRPKVEASLTMGEFGSPKYMVNVRKHVGRGNPAATENLKQDIITMLELHSKPISQRKIATETGAGRRAIKRVLEELVNEGTATWDSKGVKLN